MKDGRSAIVVWPAGAGPLLALLLAAAVLVGPAPARAQSFDAELFQVTGIRVDETDQTAAAARMKALAAGERRAWEVLVERLVDPAQRARMAALPNIGDAVKDFSVTDEKVSAVRYIATLNYTFRPDAVKRLLAGRSARFAVTRSKPMLVVPVLAAAPGGPAGAAGVWRDAWRSAARSRGLVPLRIADDGSDIGLPGADAAAAVDRSRLADLARRNDADDALVTIAMVTGAPDAGSRSLKVTSARYPATGNAQPLPDKTFPLGAPEGDAAVFNDAAAAVAQDVDAVWRRGNAVSTKAVAIITVRVPTVTLDDWVAMRRRLADVPQAEQVQVLAVGRDYATVAISYPGGPDDLTAALGKRGLALRNDGSGQWTVVDAALLPPPEEPAATPTPPEAPPAADAEVAQ